MGVVEKKTAFSGTRMLYISTGCAVHGGLIFSPQKQPVPGLLGALSGSYFISVSMSSELKARPGVRVAKL